MGATPTIPANDILIIIVYLCAAYKIYNCYNFFLCHILSLLKYISIWSDMKHRSYSRYGAREARAVSVQHNLEACSRVLKLTKLNYTETLAKGYPTVTCLSTLVILLNSFTCQKYTAVLFSYTPHAYRLCWNFETLAICA